MIIKVAPKRLYADKKNGKSFSAAVNYILAKFALEPSINTPSFQDAINYVANLPDDPLSQALTPDIDDKCLAVTTHGVTSLAAAVAEMDAVAARNTRCKDPIAHLIMSWPDHERPTEDAIFAAANKCITDLGMADHQYVIAIHVNTDNIHAHLAINIVNPTTYASKHLSYTDPTGRTLYKYEKLSHIAREIEIEHGWAHDNGIFIIGYDATGKKVPVLNPDFDRNNTDRKHRTKKTAGAPWHDADTLATHASKHIAPALKKALPAFTHWQDLHQYLAGHHLTLTDSGGGGMKLRAIDPETGLVLTLPASKAFRFMKRKDLEAQFGPFEKSTHATNDKENDHDTIDTTGTDADDTREYRLDPLRSLSGAFPPPPPATLAGGAGRGIPPHLRQRMHHLSELPMADEGEETRMLLSNPLRLHLDDLEARTSDQLRHAFDRGPTNTGSRSGSTSPPLTGRPPRDPDQRAQRADERRHDRQELRGRYLDYRESIITNRDQRFAAKQTANQQRSQAIKSLRDDYKTARQSIIKDKTIHKTQKAAVLLTLTSERTIRRLKIEADHQARIQSITATHAPALDWRNWLRESAQNGDQAALAALRGIIYREGRQATRLNPTADGPTAPLTADYLAAHPEHIDHSSDTLSIRPTLPHLQHPWQAAPLLKTARNMSYHITDNGNVVFITDDRRHLFTDRGNRITFDRETVTDDEIRLALIHAQEKYGSAVTLTSGTDEAGQQFLRRMALIAADMNIAITNPELQPIIEQQKAIHQQPIQPTPTPTPEAPATPARPPPSTQPQTSVAPPSPSTLWPPSSKPPAAAPTLAESSPATPAIPSKPPAAPSTSSTPSHKSRPTTR